MQPDSLYRYRVFASNGFVHSDTVYHTIHTPMPLLTGVMRIPGDYPSINALLVDAGCKHVGPSLVIELQANYSYSLENIPVRFNRFLQTKVLKNITVRPAVGVTLRLTAAQPTPLFTVDSVKYVCFDGRPGGTGTTIGLTVEQKDQTYPAISYVHFADSGTVQYCNVEGASRNNTFGLIYLGYQDKEWVNYPPGVDGTNILYCRIGPSTGYSDRLLVMSNNARGNHFRIEGNEFHRFKDAAIFYFLGGEGTRITRNRFYQPEYITGACKAIECNTQNGALIIDSNLIGGSRPEWGQGQWTSTSPFATSSLIDISGGSANHTLIRGNRFANIAIADGALHLLTVKGEMAATIEGNQFGTRDSSNSIRGNDGSLNGVFLSGFRGKKTVAGNVFSGFTSNGEMNMLLVSGLDSLLVKGNDFGGSDRRNANQAKGGASAVNIFATLNAKVVGNEIRGITSSAKGVAGIINEWSGSSGMERYMSADSNNIHHLQGKLTVYGIAATLYSNQKNQINNNHIYALRAIGPHAAIGASQPNFTGGIIINHQGIDLPGKEHAAVEVSRNNIHSLEYEFEMPEMPYIYSATGISVTGENISITNNMIQLGIAAKGQPTDSIELETTGLVVTPLGKAMVEHNSIYIGGVGNRSIGADFIQNTYSGLKKIFFTNNIIQIDRRKFHNSNEDIVYINTGGHTKQVTNIASNYNIWYSQIDQDIAVKMKAWRNRSGGDSSSFIIDPKFIRPNGDSSQASLHIQAQSPADKAGTLSFGDIPIDFDGELRLDLSPADIGADAVNHCNGTIGNLSLTIQSGGPSVNICPGTTVILQASVTGGQLTRLQWQRDLQDIEGAQSATYTVALPGSYRLIGYSDCGQIASKAVEVTFSNIAKPTMYLNANASEGNICEKGSVYLRTGFNNTSLRDPIVRWYRDNLLQANRKNVMEVFDAATDGETFKVELLFAVSCGTIVIMDSITIHTVPSRQPKIELLSNYTRYRTGDTDSIKFRLDATPAGVTTSAYFVSAFATASLHIEGDSLVIINKLPSGFPVQFRLFTESKYNMSCFNPDTTRIIELRYGTNDPVIPPVPVDSLNLYLYPNPSTGSVWLQSPNLSGPASVEMYNSYGKKMYATNIVMLTGYPSELKLPSFIEGLYYIRVFVQNKYYTLTVFLH